MTCERVVIINKGTVVAEDTPTNLTRTLTGGQRVRLAVSGPEEAIREKLSQLDMIQTVELLETGNESSPMLFSLTSDSEDEITPAVATVVVNNGWNLFELSSESVSLEDVFLHLTTKEEGTVQ
jgi:ABC-2 type transport system ATP-binding protein